MAGRAVTVFIAVVFICTSFTIRVGASPPETIRVGLRFDATAPSSVRVSSGRGIEFGCDAGSGFMSLYVHAGRENVHVRKDSFFVNNNGLLIEKSIGDAPASGITFGPYHSQVSGTFPDRQQAEALLQEVGGQGLDGYLAYDGGWRVWIGRYITEQEMKSRNAELRDRLGGAHDIHPVYPSDGRLQLNDENGKVLFMFEGGNGFLIGKPLDESFINVDGKRFRGNIEFKRHGGGGITVVNSLALQHYLYGVVPKEVNPDWHMEVLKAQAVAARNFAVVNLNKHGAYGFDVCSGTDCQVYGGLDSEKPSTNAAVDETTGQMIYYQGRPITAFFHASSGGHTKLRKRLSISLSYIKAVDDSFDAGSRTKAGSWSIRAGR